MECAPRGPAPSWKQETQKDRHTEGALCDVWKQRRSPVTAWLTDSASLIICLLSHGSRWFILSTRCKRAVSGKRNLKWENASIRSAHRDSLPWHTGAAYFSHTHIPLVCAWYFPRWICRQGIPFRMHPVHCLYAFLEIGLWFGKSDHRPSHSTSSPGINGRKRPIFSMGLKTFICVPCVSFYYCTQDSVCQAH